MSRAKVAGIIEVACTFSNGSRDMENLAAEFVVSVFVGRCIRREPIVLIILIDLFRANIGIPVARVRLHYVVAAASRRDSSSAVGSRAPRNFSDVRKTLCGCAPRLSY